MEVEADRRNDVAWNRPSWKLGTQGSFKSFSPSDPLGIYRETVGEIWDDAPKTNPDPGRPRPYSAQEKALTTLELSWPLTLKSLKSQYKKLVKVHHPDANNGNKQAEERFKSISIAYAVLLDHLNEYEKVIER